MEKDNINTETYDDLEIPDNFAPLFLAMMTLLGKPDTSMLEKEISYLHGKVDTLEKIILS